MNPSSPLTLPNALTLLRILAIPFFAIAVWYGHHWQAFILFAAAGFTDLLDGFIARTFNQSSDLGAILDPAADKLLMTTAFVLLAWRTQGMTAPIPVWVAILAITRDGLISFYAFASVNRLSDTRFQPSLLGKLSTATQLLAVTLGLLFNALGHRPWMDPFLPVMYWVVAALALCSGIHYFMRATRASTA
jgi:cardiolipin synthase (CMP-forming)